jgi:ERCC4-type nuclease
MTPTLIPTPYTVVIDTREQLGYTFAQPLKQGRGLLAVQTTTAGLQSGDYSLAGFEDRVAIERKSMSDAFGTFGQGRARFVRELERLAAYDFAAVVVEAEWSTIWMQPPARARLKPKSIACSVVAWQMRFPRVHWHFLPGREVAEAFTITILDRFWREQHATAWTKLEGGKL